MKVGNLSSALPFPVRTGAHQCSAAAVSLRPSARSVELKIEHTLSYGKAHTDAVRRRRTLCAPHKPVIGSIFLQCACGENIFIEYSFSYLFYNFD